MHALRLRLMSNTKIENTSLGRYYFHYTNKNSIYWFHTHSELYFNGTMISMNGFYAHFTLLWYKLLLYICTEVIKENNLIMFLSLSNTFRFLNLSYFTPSLQIWRIHSFSLDISPVYLYVLCNLIISCKLSASLNQARSPSTSLTFGGSKNQTEFSLKIQESQKNVHRNNHKHRKIVERPFFETNCTHLHTPILHRFNVLFLHSLVPRARSTSREFRDHVSRRIFVDLQCCSWSNSCKHDGK